MDPNATLTHLKWALVDLEAHPSTSYREELQDDIDTMCDTLATWLAKGGFQPDWFARPKAAGYFLTWYSKRG